MKYLGLIALLCGLLDVVIVNGCGTEVDPECLPGDRSQHADLYAEADGYTNEFVNDFYKWAPYRNPGIQLRSPDVALPIQFVDGLYVDGQRYMGFTHGHCQIPTIQYDRFFWQSLSVFQRRMLVYHENGHGQLHLPHSPIDGKPHIMENPMPSEDYVNGRWDDLVREEMTTF